MTKVTTRLSNTAALLLPLLLLLHATGARAQKPAQPDAAETQAALRAHGGGVREEEEKYESEGRGASG